MVAVEGIQQVEGLGFTLDEATGEVVFVAPRVPVPNTAVYAGFEFDVPVRFDIDEITVNMTNFIAGEIATIPLVEILA